MARPAKPWYWEARGGWYATVAGRRVLLARGRGSRAEALAELGRLLKDAARAATARPAGETVLDAAERFLLDCRRTLKPLTCEYYTQYLGYLCERHPDLPLADLRPKHVDGILASKEWRPNTQRALIACCKRLTSWAHKRGDLESDPLAKMPRPREQPAAEMPDADAVRAVLAAIKGDNFRDIVTAIWRTGCRVSEAYRVEARHVDLDAGTWTFDGKTSGATGRPRVVHLTPDVVAICRKWMARHPDGPIFRNDAGKPWPRQLLSQRLRILRRRLGLGEEVKLKGLRHLFVTDGLERGVPIATVAELAGHTDTRMVSRVYSKLHKRTEHLKSALLSVRGPGAPSGPGSPATGDLPAEPGPGPATGQAPVPPPPAPPASRRGRRRAGPA